MRGDRNKIPEGERETIGCVGEGYGWGLETWGEKAIKKSGEGGVQ